MATGQKTEPAKKAAGYMDCLGCGREDVKISGTKRPGYYHAHCLGCFTRVFFTQPVFDRFDKEKKIYTL